MIQNPIFTRRRILAGGAAFAGLVASPAWADTMARTLESMPALSGGEREQILAAIASLSEEGLDPNDYGYAALRAGTGDARAAWFAAGSHMLRGKTDPVRLEPDWTAPRRVRDLAQALDAARASGRLAQSLAALAPEQEGYRALRAELARLRDQSAGTRITVASGPALRVGMQGERVEALQARLAQLGYGPASPAGVFDVATADALKAYQDSVGLDADAVAGAGTLGALNRGDQERLDSVRVNMDRWRWLPDQLGAKHVRVNIAGFSVEAWQNGGVERVHNCIVGKPFRKTPVFSEDMRYIIFNPWWEVPPSLARADKLPLFRRDPSAVDRLGYQVLDASGNRVGGVDWNALPDGRMPYRLRQAPGPLNALGQVKMMFPNRHNVYLHDTPDRGLFARRQRAFSSGCIRTQDPLDLSAWLLSDTPGWSRERIQEVIDGGKETRVDMSARVPVHILYMTAVPEVGGGVRYLDDIYGRDAAVLAALNA